MKKSLFTIASLSLLLSCGTMAHNKGVAGKSYGPEKVDQTTAISTDDMIKKFEMTHADQQFTIEGKITQVCQSAGCWVMLETGNGDPLMVRFKNHFTIPTTTPAGSKAYLHGITYMDTTSVEMLKHYAEDAKKSQEEIDLIKEPKVRMMFEADGISFPVATEKN